MKSYVVIQFLKFVKSIKFIKLQATSYKTQVVSCGLVQLISFGFLALCFQLSANTIYAQQVRLSIDPPIVQSKIKPGKSILVAYTVENGGDPVAVQFVIYAFQPVGRTGGVELIELDGPIEFTLENADVSLKTPFFFNSKERKQALVRISIPSTAPEGDYYYMIVAETVPHAPSEGRSQSQTSAQIGAPLLISVTESGLTEVQARIAEFSVSNTFDITIANKKMKFIDSSQMVPVTLVIENQGNNVIQPKGTITVRYGKTTKTINLLEQNILKKSQRIIYTRPSTNAPAHVSAMLSGFGIGKHTVTSQVSYGAFTPVQFAHVELYAVPIRMIGLGIITLLFSSSIVLYSHKKKRTNKVSN